jgi:hypothetical protein
LNVSLTFQLLFIWPLVPCHSELHSETVNLSAKASLDGGSASRREPTYTGRNTEKIIRTPMVRVFRADTIGLYGFTIVIGLFNYCTRTVKQIKIQDFSRHTGVYLCLDRQTKRSHRKKCHTRAVDVNDTVGYATTNSFYQ